MTDLQWLWTYLTIIPFVLGVIVSLFMLKFKKSHFIILGVIALSVVAWIVVSNINTHGSEGPALRCLQLSCSASGMALVETIKFICYKLKK